MKTGFFHFLKHHIYISILVLSVILSLALYGNSLGGEFVYDDYYVVPLTELRDPRSLIDVWFMPYHPGNPFAGTYRPFSMFTFALNFILFGEGTTSFHLVNIFINAVSKFFFFVVVYKLFGSRKLAFFSFLVYTFFPIHVENVAYIKARDDMMGALFTFLSWIFFIKATSRGVINPKLMIVSSLTFFFAPSSKELTILNPAIFLLVYWWKDQASFLNVFKAGLYFVPPIVAFLILRFITFEGIGVGFLGFYDIFYIANPLKFVDISTRLISALQIVFMYIQKILLPINLSATYHFAHFEPVKTLFSWQVIAGLLFFSTLVLVILNGKTRGSVAGIGALIFLVPYILISQVFFAAGDVIGEKWMYLPSAGIALFVGYLALKLFEFKRVLSISFLTILVICYAPVIITRNKVWASPKALYDSMAKDAPKSVQGHYGLGIYYLRNGEIERSKAEAIKAFEIYDSHPPTITLLGNIAFWEKRYEEAEKMYLLSIKLDPTYASTYASLASLYFASGRYDLARDIFRSGLDRAPGRPKPEFVVGYAASLAKLKEYQRCLEVLDSRKYILEGDRGHPGVKLMYALCNWGLGRPSEARKYMDWGSDNAPETLDFQGIFETF